MSTLATFHLFPTLPIEIRLKIWSIALLHPRILTIKCNKEPYQRYKPRAVVSWTSDSPPPPLLSVNRETRYEALALYAPYFRTLFSPKCIYVNWKVDKVRFADGVIMYLGDTERALIETMVLETKDCGYFGHYNMEILMGMGRLKELDIWARKGENYSWERSAVRDYVNMLVIDFEGAREMHKGWRCPRVRIFGESGEVASVVEGGAWIEGWTEETAHLFEVDE
jgi:hypothetical protein